MKTNEKMGTVVLIDDTYDTTLEVARHFFPLLWEAGIATEIFLFGDAYKSDSENVKEWDDQKDIVTKEVVKYFKAFCQGIAKKRGVETIQIVERKKHLIGWGKDEDESVFYDCVLDPEKYKKEESCDTLPYNLEAVDWLKLTKDKVVLLDLALRKGDLDETSSKEFASAKIAEIITDKGGARKVFPLTQIIRESLKKKWEIEWENLAGKLSEERSEKVEKVRSRQDWVCSKKRGEIEKEIITAFYSEVEENG